MTSFRLHPDPDQMAETPVATARAVFMPLGRGGERIAIAVVGAFDGHAFARPIVSSVLRCLPHDLGQAFHSFGLLVVADYLDWCANGRAVRIEWRLPLADLHLGDQFEIDAQSVEEVSLLAASQFALADAALEESIDGKTVSSPRSSDESRFLSDIQAEIGIRSPALARGFHRKFSLAGVGIESEIDFVGSSYATCYSAINPKGRTAVRLRAATAALWRLARARDAFGGLAPLETELTAWVPPDGLPIYSATDYELVRSTVAELREQAKRENIQVWPARSSLEAARRLIEKEGGKPVS